MKTIEIISQDVFDKIRSRFENLQMGDEEGSITMDPRLARFFDFDFAMEGTTLGRVSISINELGTLKVFYGRSLLEDSDPISRHYWYNFLREMRNFAKRRLLRFDTRDITKSNLNKEDFQFLAKAGTKDENMNVSESVKFSGTKKTSQGVVEKIKIKIKHKKPIEDESFGARSRRNNMEAIFIENEIGERYKMPVLWLEGAKMMARHCQEGGKPWDELGEAINSICHRVAELQGFKRHAVIHDSMNLEASKILERVGMTLENLKAQAHRISTRQGYREWSESFEPTSTMQGMVELDAATMEDYKSKFTVSSFKEDLAKYFPLIHSIMQEAGTVDLEDYVNEGPADEPEDQDPDADDKRWDDIDEGTCNECGMWESKCTCDNKVKEHYFTKFIDWADSLVEGRLGMDQLGELDILLKKNLTLGDGTVAIAELSAIGIEDDDLEKLITAKSNLPNGEDTPLKDVVAEWLTAFDPQSAEELGLTQAPEAPPAEAPPAEVPPEGEPTTADMDPNEAEETTDKPSMKELAEWIAGHYNTAYEEQGVEPMRKGPTELGIMAEKEFGAPYGELVEKMCSEMFDTPLERVTRKADIRNAEKEADDNQSGQLSPIHGEEEMRAEELEKIRSLAGLSNEGMTDTVKKVAKKVAGGINKAIGHGSDEEMIKDLQKKTGVAQTGKKPESKTNEEFELMRRLAGLAK
jgi:hypothetical protein